MYLDVAAGKGDNNNLQDVTPSTPAGTVVKTPAAWTTLQGTAISDGNGTAIPLPTGLYYVGGNNNTGLVVSDKENDTMDASGSSSGNQFVWIPVTDLSETIRTEFDSNGNPTSGLNVHCAEPYENGYSGEDTEFYTMKTQVLKYGGFYIGRFEAGINSDILRNQPTTDQTVVCKKGVAPYNYVPWGASMSDINSIVTSYIYDSNWNVTGTVQSHGVVYLSKSLYNNSNSVTSTLCYGTEWDAMCRYIGDSQRTTPTKSSPQLTGNVSTDVSKNIYDLAGNCGEWTMESCGEWCRVYRGGMFNWEVPISNRYLYQEDLEFANHDQFAFRIALYVK